MKNTIIFPAREREGSGADSEAEVGSGGLSLVDVVTYPPGSPS